MAAVDFDGMATARGPSDYVPLWFERALVVAIAGVLSFGGSGLSLPSLATTECCGRSCWAPLAPRWAP